MKEAGAIQIVLSFDGDHLKENFDLTVENCLPHDDDYKNHSAVNC